MSCSTTRRKAGRAARPCATAGWTTALTTGSIPTDPARYVDTTGCGNSLNVGHPTALRMIMDSLRYWVTEMGVDGFRFDLAPTLAREDGAFDPFSAFFDLVAQDPVISRAKLIAEPWDVGRADSYEVGRFPPLWSEWNGRFRDTVRDWWRSQDGRLAEFASRLCGSSDIYGDRSKGRRPSASVNFVTVHDGFTLNDLVSYDHKHNEANGEDNRDGTDDNRSWNCGAEGPTTDQDVARAPSAAEAGAPADPASVRWCPVATGRRRTWSHPTGQQQRVLPRQQDHLV